MKVQGNGLVELVDERSSDSGWFCMALVAKIRTEANNDPQRIGELWHQRFAEAESGRCFYRLTCAIHARTQEAKPVQLSLDLC